MFRTYKTFHILLKSGAKIVVKARKCRVEWNTETVECISYNIEGIKPGTATPLFIAISHIAAIVQVTK